MQFDAWIRGRPARNRKAVDVGIELDALVERYGAPEYLRCDNGSQFIAFVVQQWAERRGVKMAHIDPGKPWQNGRAESFVGTCRRESKGLSE